MGCAKLGAFWQGRSPDEGRRALDAALHAGINPLRHRRLLRPGDQRAAGRARAAAVPATWSCAPRSGSSRRPAALLLARRSGLASTSASAASPAAARRRAATSPATSAPRSSAACGGSAASASSCSCSTRRRSRRSATQRFLPALDELVRSGKVGAFGLSCATADEADAALAVPRPRLPPDPLQRRPPRPAGARPGPSPAERGVGILAAGPFGDSGLLGARSTAGPSDLLRIRARAPGVGLACSPG